jgi:GNAT superfamily N-acetyltransferase
MREDAQHTSAASALSIEITAIVVEPFFRRRGIARAILAAALAATRELGCKLILRNVQNPTIERHARELGFADEPTAKHLNMVFKPSAT